MTDLTRVKDGAASVADVERHALEAIEAIDNVTTAEEAEDLLRRVTAYQQVVKIVKVGREQERRWAVIRLQAERKMGELLGPAENHGPATVTPGHGSTDDSDRKANERARKIAAVPQEDFEEYIETAEEPSRAGLLRTVKEQPADKPGPQYTSCPTCGHRVRADKPLRPQNGAGA